MGGERGREKRGGEERDPVPTTAWVRAIYRHMDAFPVAASLKEMSVFTSTANCL